MQSLPLVYAYRDDGPVLEIKTRWEPRKVFCTQQADHSDAPGVRHVVKYRRDDPASAAACISEVVSYAILKALEIRTLEAALVFVRPDLARSYDKAENIGYNTKSGLHFSTIFNAESEAGPPPLWDMMADPQEAVAIWVADCWLMNLDRCVEGNTRLVVGKEGRFHLLAADQSDCFLGSGSFADGSYLARSKKHNAAAFPDKKNFVERAVMESGCDRLYNTLAAILQMTPQLAEMMTLAPAEWWAQANIAASDVVSCLTQRADRMREIVDVPRWEGLSRVADKSLRLF